MLGLDGSEKFTRDSLIDVPADSSMRVFVLPEPTGTTDGTGYFADLRLTGADGKPISTNFYWLSTHPDVLADSSTWYNTAVKSYANYTGLRSLPASSPK